MAFKLKSSSPLRIETDPKLKYNKYKEYSLEKDMDYLNKNKKAVDSNKSTKQGFFASFSPTNRAQARVDDYKKRGGITSTPSVKATTPKDKQPLSAGDGVRKTKVSKTKVSKPKVTKTPVFDGGIKQAKKSIGIKDTGNNKKVLPDTTKKQSFKSAYDKRDKKIYGNLSQSQFTTESKRQMASKKAGKGYDAPKKQMGEVRKKVEAVKPMKAAGSDVKRQTPKLAGDVRTKAQKLRAKGEGILANKKLSTRQKQKQSGAVRKQYDAEMATQKKKKPVVEVKKKEVVKKKSNERFMF